MGIITINDLLLMFHLLVKRTLVSLPILFLSLIYVQKIFLKLFRNFLLPNICKDSPCNQTKTVILESLQGTKL